MALGPYLALCRPRHWVKNVFVLAPLFFTPSALALETVLAVAGGFVCFSLAASAVYVLNDLADREADRLHPRKRARPLASGAVGVGSALVLLAGLALSAVLGAMALGSAFTGVVIVYGALNLAYSLGLKRIAVIDVMVVALGYVLRVEGGALLAGVEASPWIVICTGLLTLFIALAKRRDDIVAEIDRTHRPSLDGYTREFIDTSIAVVAGAVLVAYMVYTTDATVMARLGTKRLFVTTPWVLLGLLRYLQITMVERLSGNPTEIVTSDRLMLVAILGWVGTFAWLLYG